MLHFVGTTDERTGSVIKQVKRNNVLLNSASQLSDLETDRCNNENKKIVTKILYKLTIHGQLFESCKSESDNLNNFNRRVIIGTNI